MRKAIFYSALFWIVFIIVISIVIYVTNLKKTSPTEFEYTMQVGQEVVTDECVEEGKAFLETNAMQNKISPNAIFIVKNHYKDCGHTIISQENVPEDIVNLSEDELRAKYSKWSIEKYSPTEIVINKEETGICNEHYLLQEEDGGITVYSIDKNNQQKLLQRTGIVVKYLSKTDKINLKNGMRIYGRENLNKVLEDFE